MCLSAFRALHGLDAFKLPPLLKVFYFVKNSSAILQSGLLDLLCSVSNHLVCYQLGLSWRRTFTLLTLNAGEKKSCSSCKIFITHIIVGVPLACFLRASSFFIISNIKIRYVTCWIRPGVGFLEFFIKWQTGVVWPFGDSVAWVSLFFFQSVGQVYSLCIYIKDKAETVSSEDD